MRSEGRLTSNKQPKHANSYFIQLASFISDHCGSDYFSFAFVFLSPRLGMETIVSLLAVVVIIATRKLEVIGGLPDTSALEHVSSIIKELMEVLVREPE